MECRSKVDDGIGVMNEAVRLVIWDLDETFWTGTLAEGGIQTIPDENMTLLTDPWVYNRPGRSGR